MSFLRIRAIEKARLLQPALIVTDLSMPKETPSFQRTDIIKAKFLP
jgi:CheY-like chemotaxis protein